MNVIHPLQEAGLAVDLTPTGKLSIKGLSRLERYKAQALVEYARQNKARLLAELTAKTRPGRQSEPVSGLVRSYKAGRKWILQNLDQLLAAGWTRAKLFRRGRFTYPHGEWGAAWSMLWADPNVTPRITTEGFIAFDIAEPHRTVTQTTRFSGWCNKSPRPGKGIK